MVGKKYHIKNGYVVEYTNNRTKETRNYEIECGDAHREASRYLMGLLAGLKVFDKAHIVNKTTMTVQLLRIENYEAVVCEESYIVSINY